MNAIQRKEITESLIAYRKDKGVSAAHIVAMALEKGYSIGVRDAAEYVAKKFRRAPEAVLVGFEGTEAEAAD